MTALWRAGGSSTQDVEDLIADLAQALDSAAGAHVPQAKGGYDSRFKDTRMAVPARRAGRRQRCRPQASPKCASAWTRSASDSLSPRPVSSVGLGRV